MFNVIPFTDEKYSGASAVRSNVAASPDFMCPSKVILNSFISFVLRLSYVIKSLYQFYHGQF